MTRVGVALDVADRVRRYHVVGVLIGLAAAVCLLLAAAVVISRDPIQHAPSFRTVLRVAPLHVWVAAFAGVGSWIVVACLRSLDAVQLACLAAALLLAAWAGLLAWSAISDGGISTGVVAYLGLSGLASTASVACSRTAATPPLPPGGAQ